MFKKAQPWILTAALACLAIAGCSQEARNDYKAAGSSVTTAAKDAEKAVDADAVATGQSFADATDSTAKANHDTSARVKQALLDSPDIETTDLKVDTNGRTVTLHGGVQTEEQNQRAEQLARELLGSAYTVEDQLKVGGGG